MGRNRIIKGENIRSEQQMMELLGVKVQTLRKLAKEYNFTTAHISERIRLYDITDIKELFDRFRVVEVKI